MKLKTFILPTQVTNLPPMTRKEKTAYRCKHRLCVQCGVPLHPKDKRLCAVHTAAAKRAAKKYRSTHPEYVEREREKVRQKRKANPAYYAKLQRNFYQRHKENEQCTDCVEPALDDSNWCAKHKAINQAYARNYQRRRYAELKKKRSSTPR